MTKEQRKKALEHFKRAKDRLSKVATQVRSQREIDAVIAALRKTREELWEEKLAARS